MPKTKEQCFKQIAEAGVIAIIRGHAKDQLLGIAEALLAGGVSAIEISLSAPRAVAGIEMLADKFGDNAVLGAGTVLDAATAGDAIAAGAQFVVSPVFDPAVVETTRRYGRISVPGALTPTEILRAWVGGADVVKVFPATVLGPGYFRDLLAPMPQLRLAPIGGVDLRNAADWIKAGAVFVGAGSSLVTRDAVTRNDWAGITVNARTFVEAIKTARGK